MTADNPEVLIAPCPFCGNEAQENFATLSDYIVCSCGAAGPSALKVEDAVVRWNKRVNPLPFREASEKPDADGRGNIMIVVERANTLYLETCIDYGGTWAEFSPRTRAWLYESDILNAFQVWKAESITAKEGKE